FVRVPLDRRSTECPYSTLFRSLVDGDDVGCLDQRGHVVWFQWDLDTDHVDQLWVCPGFHIAHTQILVGLNTCRTLPHKDGTSLQDRKSTRLNSSHVSISYAVFC